MLDVRSLLARRLQILFLARGDHDMVGAGWVSVLARGNAMGIKIAQAESVLR
jgi:hypothetical protein